MAGHVGKQVSAFDTGRCFQPLFGHVDARAFDTHQLDVVDPYPPDVQGLQKSPRRDIVNTCGSGCFRRPRFRLFRPARAV